MSHYYVRSLPHKQESTGTLITVSSGRAGLTTAGGSAYNISKLAEERLNEHLQLGKGWRPIIHLPKLSDIF